MADAVAMQEGVRFSGKLRVRADEGRRLVKCAAPAASAVVDRYVGM